MHIQENKDLRHFNTFGLSASAQYFVAVSNAQELKLLLEDPSWQVVPKFILGGGSNILLTQNFSGLVIKNEIKGIQLLAEDSENIWVQVGAGENWHQFVLYCIEQGYAGIENLSLIPGTVGAAPMQNIGAYGVELREVFHECEAIKIADGSFKTFTHQECEFGYRDSIFKTKYKNEYIITNVTLRLRKHPQFNISYGALQETLDDMKLSHLTLKNVSDAVIKIRRSKLPDPTLIGNAGSFFKNPIISAEQFNTLQQQFAPIPHFATESKDFIKVSAGWLIEQCGWKGKRLGDVGVHDKQALVLVNFGQGTGAAVLALAQQIQESVKAKFGIMLMPEVNFVG